MVSDKGFNFNNYVFMLVDRNGNEIECDVEINTFNLPDGEVLVKFVLDLINTPLSVNHRNMISDLIVGKVSCGGDISTIENYLRLYEKINAKKIV